MSTAYFDSLLAQHATAHEIYVLTVSTGDREKAYKMYLEMKVIEGHWHNPMEFAHAAQNYQARQLIESTK